MGLAGQAQRLVADAPDDGNAVKTVFSVGVHMGGVRQVALHPSTIAWILGCASNPADYRIAGKPLL
jgi:hypothetical protein